MTEWFCYSFAYGGRAQFNRNADVNINKTYFKRKVSFVFQCRHRNGIDILSVRCIIEK